LTLRQALATQSDQQLLQWRAQAVPGRKLPVNTFKEWLRGGYRDLAIANLATFVEDTMEAQNPAVVWTNLPELVAALNLEID
jgi:hypothetical protein